MPLSQAQITALFSMTPEGALRYLDNKGLRIRLDAKNMSAADHAHAFGFANLARLDIAQDLVNGMREGLANGQTPRWFIDNMTPTLRKKGWWGTEENIDLDTGEITRKQLGNPARLATIYRTTTQSAFMAGRYESMLANVQARPYWRYVAVLDARTRPSHAKLHNRVFHYSDPIWQFIFPPNGFNCRCRVEALTEAEVKALGLVISRTDAVVTQDAVTGEDENGNAIMTPVSGVRFTAPDGKEVTFFPDVGFDINPGRQVWKANLDRYDVELARPYVAAGLSGPELTQMLKTASQPERSGEMLAAAVLAPEDMAALGVKFRTAWLAEHRLAQQASAGTLPARTDWPQVQATIESATVVVKVNTTLLCYSQVAGQWFQAALDQSMTVLSFMAIDDTTLAIALQRGETLRDLR
jgi:SPP1 gp7 family putative phage head morphogenesis protein